jgi:FkbM family methyltransferase
MREFGDPNIDATRDADATQTPRAPARTPNLVGRVRRAPMASAPVLPPPPPARLRPDSTTELAPPLVPLNATRLRPRWPGRPYALACPEATPAETCASLSSRTGALADGCTEPEPDTVEVLDSFLLGREGALYVDVGCNIGYHAAHAAALGALVECYEPTPMYAQAILETRRLNRAAADRWTVHNVAITTSTRRTRLRFHGAYQPCGIGSETVRRRRHWDAPTVPLIDVLRGRHIALLKLDVDSAEGRMLRTVERAIAAGETSVETILVELGSMEAGDAWCVAEAERATPNAEQHTLCPPLPREDGSVRGGGVRDVWRMLHEHGYDVYRVNVHAAREVYDWRGRNVNTRMAATPPGLEPMFHVRAMRKLEKLSVDTPLEAYPNLFRWGQSYLLTRVQLAHVAKQHWFDLMNLHLGHSHVKPSHVKRPNSSEHARLQRTLLNSRLPQRAQ